MTVLLAIHRLPADAAHEAREACKALELEAVDWTRGVPRATPVAVISGLPRGERRIPDDVIALLEATPASRLVLCAQEPLVRPRVVLSDGRVNVLGPPPDRTQLIAALRALTAPPPPIEITHDRRFEVLRRSYWVAWTRGRAGPPVGLHEQRGATVIVGAPRDPAAIAELIGGDPLDAERESLLRSQAGDAGVIHLTRDAHEWLVYWPFERCPLWLCSADRLPARWTADPTAARALLRMPAFTGDQLVAAWSDAPDARDALASIQQLAVEGGSETILELDAITQGAAHVTGLVIEVR